MTVEGPAVVRSAPPRTRKADVRSGEATALATQSDGETASERNRLADAMMRNFKRQIVEKSYTGGKVSP
jgi:hypothetical protein